MNTCQSILASALCGIIFISVRPVSAGDNHPFPHNVQYAHGIAPTNFSQAQKNTDVEAMWQAWRKTYLIAEGAGPGELRVTMGGARGVAISEGTGYGMLISAYMANPTNSGKADFDSIYRYYKRHEKVMGGTNYGLMAWRVGPDNKIADNWVAPDGDMDAAFALLVADWKWSSNGDINYRKAATNIINNLMKWCINKPSFTVSRGEFESDYTMSSYHIVSYFPHFAKATGDARWNKVTAASYAMFDYFYRLNPATALTPFTFMVQGYGVSKRGYAYSYDSSRVPWRVGLDYVWHGTAGSPLAHDLPDRNAKWLLATTGGNPTNVFVKFDLSGTPDIKGGKDPRVIVPPIAVGAMVDASNQEWLNKLYAWIRVQTPGVVNKTAFPATLEIRSCSPACSSSPATCPILIRASR